MAFKYEKELTLFSLGFLTLLLELILIRYLAGNIWNLGYFPNLVLIAVFVGMGLGFVFHQYVAPGLSVWLVRLSVIFLFLLLIFVHFIHPMMPGFSGWTTIVGGELYFSSSLLKTTSDSPFLLVIWFLLVLIIFTLISQKTAKLFREFRPLKSYTLDIAGSCCGILLFMFFSFLSLPACIWFLFLLPLFLLVCREGSLIERLIIYIPIIAITGLVYYQDTYVLTRPDKPSFHEARWSPYQRVDYFVDPEGFGSILVNGLGHQKMMPSAVIANSFYTAPYIQRHIDNPDKPFRDILIIGAGSGNDVAAALLFGARFIDAVEIDPVIASFGEKYHPANPYGDRRVNLVIDDGRSFMTNSKRKYDLVVFAFTDSLVKASPIAQLRLENYLFTKEAIQRAWQLLKVDGELYFYNTYRQPWLVDKYLKGIYAATGKYPRLVAKEDDFHIISVSKQRDNPNIFKNDSLDQIDVSTDDWPFLYLKKRTLPPIYALVMAVLIIFVGLLMIFLHRTTRKFEGYKSDLKTTLIKLAFVIMGISFLLLETKSIVQFSLLFGTTWFNSSLVFLAVLLLILLANWTANAYSSKGVLIASYVLIIIFCLTVLLYPLSNLLYYENKIVRFVFATLLTFSPIYFANLIFTITFKKQQIPEHMFGWNLLGATLGGVIEYFSMACGYNFLAVVVAVSYSAAISMIWSALKMETTSDSTLRE